jgi:hypothetical protein
MPSTVYGPQQVVHAALLMLAVQPNRLFLGTPDDMGIGRSAWRVFTRFMADVLCQRPQRVSDSPPPDCPASGDPRWLACAPPFSA